jgi:hypothetical protein
MRRLLIAASAVVWALAAAGPSLAAFETDSAASRVSLIPGDPESGSVLVRFQSLQEQIVWGQPEKVLSLSLQVDNGAADPFVIRIIDVWLVTGSGTVISQPELREDGLAVTEAVVEPGETVDLTLAFYLGPAEPFDDFHLHWGGRLGAGTVTGVVPFTATEGGGFAQISAAWTATEGAGGEQAYAEQPHGEQPPASYTTYNVYGGYSYPYQPYVSFSFGFGYWWGWPYYWYYPWWPCWRPVACHYGGCYYPYYGPSKRRTKEDAVLREAGYTPERSGSGRGGTRGDESVRTRSSDDRARGGDLAGDTRSRADDRSRTREPGYRSRAVSGTLRETGYRSEATGGRAPSSTYRSRSGTSGARGSSYQRRVGPYSGRYSGRSSAYRGRSGVYRSRTVPPSVRGGTARSRGTSYTSRSRAARGRSSVARGGSSVSRGGSTAARSRGRTSVSRGRSSASRVSRPTASRLGRSSVSRGRSGSSRSSGGMSRGSRGGGSRGGGRGGGRR